MENERRPSEQERRRSSRKKQSTGRRNIGGTIGRTIGTLFLVFVLTCAMFAGIFMTYVNTTLSKEASLDMDDYTAGLTSFLYYQDKTSGEWTELDIIKNREYRVEVGYEQMPEYLWQAAVAIEDERFFKHNGVDWWRTGGAVVNMFIGMRDTFGGSTITQQMIKNVTGENEGTVKRKVTEIFRALDVEKKLSKQDILEKYLNNIFLGRGYCYGVQMGAMMYFGKDVSELTLAECASLIGITNNPSQYDPFISDWTREQNKKRQELILDMMADEETGLCFITQAEADAAKAEVLQFSDGSNSEEGEADRKSNVSSYFEEQVIRDVIADLVETYGYSEALANQKLRYGGYRVYTTVDPDIQAAAEAVYADRANADYTSRRGQQLRSGITIVENTTGNVVGMVGDIGEKEGDLVWNYASDRHQCGSSIKPVASYAPALDANVITMATVLDDSPVRPLNNAPWPKNSNGRYDGLTTMSKAVAGSVNTIAVRVNEMLGVQNSFDFMTENLGFQLVNDDLNSAALGLGGLTKGVTTQEMAAAFAAFSNEGIYNKPRTYVKVTDAEGNVILENQPESKVAMKETTAYFMNQLLVGVVNNGTGGGGRISGMTVAGKTGTTSDNYDRYFVGYTPYYSAAVWCGYKQNEKIVASVNPAAALWRKVMTQVHDGLPNKSFFKPSGGLSQVTICLDSGLRATDACAKDVRGASRVATVSVASGTEPVDSCNIHQEVSFCSEGKCLASEFCPETALTTVSVLNFTRDSFGATVSDTPYLYSTYETALTESGGCPVHTTAVVLPPDIGDTGDGGEGGTTPDGGGQTGGDNGDWWEDQWGGLAPPVEPDEPTV